MINFNFNLRNPFSPRWKVVKVWAGKTYFKNKYWEVQVDKTADIVGFEFRYTIRQSHAGLWLCASLLGYELTFNFYDSRHWNYEVGKWYMHDEHKEDY